MDGSLRPNTQEGGLQALYGEMRPHSLYPLWEVLHALVTPEPRSGAQPHLWPYAEARDFLLRAGDLISAEQAERRVLILENPGLPGTSSATTSLYAGLQLILPGEVAPCHRHTQSALRFVVEGDGAFTAVDGEKAVMRPFDLVLTPNWRWHDHGNATSGHMIWLDGLDIPTVRAFDASFAERLPEKAHPETAAPDTSRALHGQNLRPRRAGTTTGDRRASDRQPLFRYPHDQWRSALDALARTADPDPHLGHALEFTNPADGGAVMPTVSAEVRLIPRGTTTRPRRVTDGTVFTVVEAGEGGATAIVSGRDIPLAERDVFVVPSWAEASLRAPEGADLVVFAYSDRTAQEKLGLYREALG